MLQDFKPRPGQQPVVRCAFAKDIWAEYMHRRTSTRHFRVVAELGPTVAQSGFALYEVKDHGAP